MRSRLALCLIVAISTTVVGEEPREAWENKPANQPGIVREELIFVKAPFAQCHASTIEETNGGVVAAWFGGTSEGNKDVGIWVSRHREGSWSAPLEVANGVQYAGHRHPCWNPVLFQPRSGPLLLFYKVGPSPKAWWGMLVTSTDGGSTWSEPRRLPERIDGPVRSKPIQLPGGEIFCGSSIEYDGWRVHFEITPDLGRTWKRIGPVNHKDEFDAIQPTLLHYPDGRLQALCRTRSQVVSQVSSLDGGHTWGKMSATTLPNPNAGLDGVTLADGRQLIVYNHTTRRGKPSGREMINVAISTDGTVWKAALVLERERGEFSYPAVIQSSDGLVHATYTYKRRSVKHVVIDPSQLRLQDLPDGAWPKS